MNDNVEASVRSLFGPAKAPYPPPEKAPLAPYLLASLAAPILISKTIAIAAQKPEPPRYRVIHHKVPSVDQTIQPVAYHPPNIKIDIPCVGCAHIKTRNLSTSKQQESWR